MGRRNGKKGTSSWRRGGAAAAAAATAVGVVGKAKLRRKSVPLRRPEAISSDLSLHNGAQQVSGAGRESEREAVRCATLRSMTFTASSWALGPSAPARTAPLRHVALQPSSSLRAPRASTYAFSASSLSRETRSPSKTRTTSANSSNATAQSAA
eukprot:scaffold259461_cov28-Tisochrysis_lutea.AAC.2